MATLYAFVWYGLQDDIHHTSANERRIAIFLAFVVYCMAARTVWQKRKELPGFLNPLNEDPFSNTVTTEIDIVSCPRDNLSPASRIETGEDYNPYSVDVKVGPQRKNSRPSMPTELMRIRSLTRTVAVNEINNPEAWLYARTSFLFFLALLVTWVNPLNWVISIKLILTVSRSHQASIAAMRLLTRMRSTSA